MKIILKNEESSVKNNEQTDLHFCLKSAFAGNVSLNLRLVYAIYTKPGESSTYDNCPECVSLQRIRIKTKQKKNSLHKISVSHQSERKKQYSHSKFYDRIAYHHSHSGTLTTLH